MKNTMKMIAALLSLSFCGVAVAQMPSMSKHAERNVACQSCHVDGKFEPPKTENCLACHPREALVKKTDRLNFVSRMKNPKTGEVKEHTALINPHNSYHFGTTEDCTDCHREHRKSVNDCATCHDTKAWGMKELK